MEDYLAANMELMLYHASLSLHSTKGVAFGKSGTSSQEHLFDFQG